MRCYAVADAHDFPVEDEAVAHCPEHGVTLLLRHDVPTSSADGPGACLGGLTAGADGPCSVICRSALVSDLADVHAVCQQSGCACSCHAADVDPRIVG
ncbi:hypothetical protein DDE05_28945 [Streptomyces cavourensis]|nr:MULTISPECIES: hypothetical protein [Streptomyces]MDI7788354.1 hypothetical protein [Streptomyces cavourensis]RBL83677.1 hypothetical protein DDE05_28945 [Streptomyces cavourensis]